MPISVILPIPEIRPVIAPIPNEETVVTIPIKHPFATDKATMERRFYFEAYNQYRDKLIQLLEELKKDPYPYDEEYIPSGMRFLSLC